MRQPQDYILLFLKGVSMGIADVIPGVSGGTIAFLTGIYEELIFSINAIDAEGFRQLYKRQFAIFWTRINGNFLVTVFAGVTTSLWLLSGVMLHLLKYYPIAIWSFFFGLIVMTIPLIIRKIKKWTPQTIAGFLIGIGIIFLITIASPIQTPDTIFFVFVAGAIAVCALVTPGISGVFILLLIGKYQYVVTSLDELNILAIFIFGFGCIVGLIGMSRLLVRAFESNYQIAISVLSGCIVGTLNKVWPWRKVMEYATNSKGDQIAVFDKSILPWDFLFETGKDPQLFQAIFLMALGVLFVVLTEKIVVRLKTKH